MPSVGVLTKEKVRKACELLEKSLKDPIIKPEEREELWAHDIPPDKRTKDDWWKRWGDLRSYARRKEWGGKGPDESVIDEAPIFSVVAEEPIEVELHDGTLVDVYPASLAKIMLVEDKSFWLAQCELMRQLVAASPTEVDNPEALMARARKEIVSIQADILAQVCSPGPEPYEGPVPSYVKRITPGDEMNLLQAWRELNDKRPKLAEALVARRFPTKKKTQAFARGPTGSLSGYPIMYSSVAFRELKTPKRVMHDRSLASMVLQLAIESQSQEHRQQMRDAERKSANKGKRKTRLR